jgi:hypothetical protein
MAAMLLATAILAPLLFLFRKAFFPPRHLPLLTWVALVLAVLSPPVCAYCGIRVLRDAARRAPPDERLLAPPDRLKSLAMMIGAVVLMGVGGFEMPQPGGPIVVAVAACALWMGICGWLWARDERRTGLTCVRRDDTRQ